MSPAFKISNFLIGGLALLNPDFEIFIFLIVGLKMLSPYNQKNNAPLEIDILKVGAQHFEPLLSKYLFNPFYTPK